MAIANMDMQRNAITSALMSSFNPAQGASAAGNDLSRAGIPAPPTTVPALASVSGPTVGTTGWDPRGGGDMRGAGGTIGAMAAAPPPVAPTPPQQPGPIGTTPPPPAALPAQPETGGWTPSVFGDGGAAPAAPVPGGDWGGATGGIGAMTAAPAAAPTPALASIGQSQVATPGTGFGTTVGGMNAQGLGQRA